MSINWFCRVVVPVSSEPRYKGAQSLLEMCEDREYGRNNDHVRILLDVLHHEFSNPSLHSSRSRQDVPSSLYTIHGIADRRRSGRNAGRLRQARVTPHGASRSPKVRTSRLDITSRV